MTLFQHAFFRQPYQLLFCLALLYPTINVADDDDAPAQKSSPPASSSPGIESPALTQNATLVISPALQASSGIKTQKLQRGHYTPEVQAAATVMDLQALLQLREQYFAAEAEYQSAQASLTAAEQAINRVRNLYQNGVNSERQMQEQQMQLAMNRAKIGSTEARLQSINENLLANWGAVLSAWAKNRQQKEIRSLVNREQVLLLISLPATPTVPSDLKHVWVDVEANRQHAQQAHFISPAPNGSQLSQGETYFFITPRANFRTGMHLNVWFASADTAVSGHVIPQSAAVWRNGQVGMFFKTSASNFTRYVLQNYYPVTQGFFVADPLPTDYEVVIQGAQLLLSHEFRSTLQEEDDGD